MISQDVYFGFYIYNIFDKNRIGKLLFVSIKIYMILTCHL